MDLSDDMRAFLRHQPETATSWQWIMDFMQHFDLGAEEAGELLAAWIRESCS